MHLYVCMCACIDVCMRCIGVFVSVRVHKCVCMCMYVCVYKSVKYTRFMMTLK